LNIILVYWDTDFRRFQNSCSVHELISWQI